MSAGHRQAQLKAVCLLAAHLLHQAAPMAAGRAAATHFGEAGLGAISRRRQRPAVVAAKGCLIQVGVHWILLVLAKHGSDPWRCRLCQVVLQA